MPTIQQTMALAMEHHQAGRLRAAEQIYRQVLGVDPNNADAWHFLGLLASQEGKPREAIELIGRAITLAPRESSYHSNLGVVYHTARMLPRAVSCYQRALAENPDSSETLNNLGNALRELGRLEEAADVLERAIRLRPEYAEANYNLGLVLQQQGRLEAAIERYRRTLALRPEHAAACNNLANVLAEQDRMPEAIECYRRTLRMKPDYAEAHNNLGNALKRVGEGEQAENCFRQALRCNPRLAEAHNNLGDALKSRGAMEEAANSFLSAVRLRADFAEAHNNLGVTLQDMGRLNEAAEHYRRALSAKPEFAQAHNNLGTVLQAMRRPEDAAACYREAIRLAPDVADTHTNLGNALRDRNRLEEALACYERAVEIDPESVAARCQWLHLRRQFCRWEDIDRPTERIIQSVEDGEGRVPPFLFLNLETTARQQLACARQWVENQLGWPRRFRDQLGFEFSRTRRDRLRIGYVTAHVREHSMAFQIAELFERHDRDRFEVFAYHYGPDDDSDIRRRMLAAFDRATDIQNLSLPDVARRIHRDGIDVLIDLVGHMHDARTEIFAVRPAPLQVMFMGYPGTTGADFMDYVILDPFLLPPDQTSFYSEQPVLLPDCFQANDTCREVAEGTPSREECGLPPEGFVFCCFNQTHKITPRMFDCWMRILEQVPGSILWLWESNPWAAANLRKEAAARGIDPERLVMAPRLPMPEHLARYRVADLALDTLPYNGHTITSESLWVGCPVVTCAGETFAARVAGSLLRAVGLPELTTDSLERYERLAVELARDPARRAEIRARLAENRNSRPLFDSRRFTRNLERALETMWDRYLAGESPVGFAVPGDETDSGDETASGE